MNGQKYIYTYKSLLFEEDCMVINDTTIYYKSFFGNNLDIHCFLDNFAVCITSDTKTGSSLKIKCCSDPDARGIYNFVQNNLYKVKCFIKTQIETQTHIETHTHIETQK